MMLCQPVPNASQDIIGTNNTFLWGSLRKGIPQQVCPAATWTGHTPLYSEDTFSISNNRKWKRSFGGFVVVVVVLQGSSGSQFLISVFLLMTQFQILKAV